MLPSKFSRAIRPHAADVAHDASGATAPSRARVYARTAFLVLIAAYALLRIGHPDWWDLLDDLNLAIHEAGHVVFQPFGETLTVLGGSLFQVIVPLAFSAYFFRTHQRYAGGVTFAWAGQSLLNVSRYISDARAQDLPLLGGENAIHDWWYLLIEWDLLERDLAIGRGVHFAGSMCFLAAIAIGALSVRASRAETRES